MDQGAAGKGSGKFPKGKSGNPAGRTPKRKRFDGWQNDLTGFGILGRDKTMGSISNTRFTVDVVDAESALQFWRGDDIAARVIETIPNEALRQGWDLCIGDNQPEPYVPPEPAQPLSGMPQQGKPPATSKRPTRDTDGGSKDLQETITKQVGDLGLLSAIRETMCYERAYGGGAILLGANDYATDLREPLDLDKVRSLDWLTPLEPRELVPRYYYNNPRAPKFGQPAIYRLVPYVVGAGIDPDYNPAYTEIHESRLIIFPGIRVSRRLIGTTTGNWGDSVLTRIIRPLGDWNDGHKAAAALLADFAQGVYKVKDLAETIAVDGPAALMAKITSIDVMRSILRSVVVDADGEDFERKATPMTGFPETLDKLSMRLAAACDMPLTLLMGQSPAGMNATGESDIRFFYDRVASVQQLRVSPVIKRVVEILLRINGEDPETINHSVRFKPLWQPSETEIATAHFAQAQADAIYLTNDVISPEEMANSRFGGDQYSYDTHVDFEARAAQEAIVAPTVEAKPEPPPIIQVGPMPAGAAQPKGAAMPRIEE